jgi:molybdate transport repressor ModE-like protein
LSELETLAICAAQGSLAAAAAELGLSRPAVAKRVASLEAIVGAKLLERGARGVRLTDAGVAVVAHGRRILAERDALMDALAAMRRGSDQSEHTGISGMRKLLGRSPSSRAALRPEAVLAETEHLFELVFHASATAFVISDPETGLVHEANDAFCRFLGRPRSEVIGRTRDEIGAAYDIEDRNQLIEQVRLHGVARDMLVRARHPDGSVRYASATAQLVALGGRPQLVTTLVDRPAD